MFNCDLNFIHLMTKKILSVLFMITILLTAAVAASINVVQDAEALKSTGTPNQKNWIWHWHLCMKLRSQLNMIV